MNAHHDTKKILTVGCDGLQHDAEVSRSSPAPVPLTTNVPDIFDNLPTPKRPEEMTDAELSAARSKAEIEDNRERAYALRSEIVRRHEARAK